MYMTRYAMSKLSQVSTMPECSDDHEENVLDAPVIWTMLPEPFNGLNEQGHATAPSAHPVAAEILPAATGDEEPTYYNLDTCQFGAFNLECAVQDNRSPQGYLTLTPCFSGGPQANTHIAQGADQIGKTPKIDVQVDSIGDSPQNQDPPFISTQVVPNSLPRSQRRTRQRTNMDSIRYELRLEKNRLAAMQYRKKMKEYISKLQVREAELEKQNRELLAQINAIKLRQGLLLN